MTDIDLQALQAQLPVAKAIEDREWTFYQAAKDKWLNAHNVVERLKDQIAVEEHRRDAIAAYLAEQRTVGAAPSPPTDTPVPS